jgi:potassium-dependent mechanosensitive channel
MVNRTDFSFRNLDFGVGKNYWATWRRSRTRLLSLLRQPWVLVLLAVFTLLLTLMPLPSWAQTGANTTDKAPVVVDGKVLFEVGKFGNFSATVRADRINTALEKEVQSPKPVKLEKVQSNKQTSIRSSTTGRTLVTLSQDDVSPDLTLDDQATDWQEAIDYALQVGKQERTIAYQRQALLVAIVVLLVALVLHFVLAFGSQASLRLIDRWLNPAASPFQPQGHPAKLFLRVARLGLEIGLWTAVAFYITDLFPQTRSWRYQLFHILNYPVISLGDTKYSALQLLLLPALTAVLWFAVSGLTQLLKTYVLRRTGAEPRVQDLVAVVAQYVFTFLGLIVLLQIWGLDVSSLAIIASVLGVGIGFGVQNIANNLISGLIITFERPIQVGDFVKVGDLLGTVKRIGARSTEIHTLDQVSIIVPNSRFLENEVVNWSYGDPVSRLRIPIGVAYGSKMEHVRAALLEAAKSHPDVLLRPHPEVWLQEFGDNALNFDLLVWTGEPKKQFRIKSDLNYRIEASLRRYGIEVPFPNVDVNLRSPRPDELINAWLQRYPSSPDKWHTYPKPEMANSQAPDLSVIAPVESPPELSEVTIASEPGVVEDIESLAAAMRESGELEIKDRHHRMNIYPACFIGSEAVEWLMKAKDCSREEAIDLGQLMIERGIIHHVEDQHPFRDDRLFYRYYTDER